MSTAGWFTAARHGLGSAPGWAAHQAAACGTAGKCGYHVAPLQEVLSAGRLKYLDLLGGALAAAVAEALHRDAQV